MVRAAVRPRSNAAARAITAIAMKVAIAWSLVALPAAGARAVEPGGGPREARPGLSLVPEKGFYDDGWALDGTGRRLAVLHTDRESFQRLEIFDLDAAPEAPTVVSVGGSPGNDPARSSGAGRGAAAGAAGPAAVPRPNNVVELDPPTRAFQALVFPPRAAEPLLISRPEGEEDKVVLESVAAAAPVAGKRSSAVPGKTAPVSAFGFATLSRAGAAATSQPVVVVVQRRSGRAGETTHVVTPLALPALNAAGKARTYVVSADGMLRPQGLVAIGFFDGYSKLLGQKPGWYDKKKDARQPDGMAVVDLLTGKISSEGAIEDVYGWARTTQLRREHPDRTAFIQLSDVTPAAGAPAASAHQESGVTLVDGRGHLSPLPLAVPFALYDRSTLKDQEGPAPGVVHFGIQIDPVNRDAVRRQKSDRPYLDIYAVPLDRPETTRLRARVAVDARPVTWFVAGHRLVVLRKFKSFARGGERLDVYDLPP